VRLERNDRKTVSMRMLEMEKFLKLFRHIRLQSKKGKSVLFDVV